jgi:hypothetical protein
VRFEFLLLLSALDADSIPVESRRLGFGLAGNIRSTTTSDVGYFATLIVTASLSRCHDGSDTLQSSPLLAPSFIGHWVAAYFLANCRISPCQCRKLCVPDINNYFKAVERQRQKLLQQVDENRISQWELDFLQQKQLR